MKVLISQIILSLRIAAITMLLCSGLYPFLMLVLGQVIAQSSIEGSIIYNDEGNPIGSELIAQAFTKPEYLWPRPSAVNYDSAQSGGSNLSPASEALHERARTIINRYSVLGEDLLPADLATASGSGIDPHITKRAALFQVERIAGARGLDRAVIEETINTYISYPGGVLTGEPLVNVLLVNISLDEAAHWRKIPRIHEDEQQPGR